MPGPIILNARALTRDRVTGVERVAAEIISRLLKRRPGTYLSAAPGRKLPVAAAHAWEQVALPAKAGRSRASIIYSPANLAPVLSPRNVLVLHDAAVWRTPESYSSTYRLAHRHLEALAARRAVHVITVSEFSRCELIDVLGLDSQLVSVIRPGVSAAFSPEVDPVPARMRYGLDRPYVLMVGSGIARKNLPLLHRLAARLKPLGIDVAWAGVQWAADGVPGSQLKRLGYVPDVDLPALYRGAEAFLLPSRYEGFGLPCLEAMACGTPVVAADRGALPETCAGAAQLADPEDEEAFLAAVLVAVDNAEERQRMRAAGIERARELTWDRAAAETDELLTQVSGL